MTTPVERLTAALSDRYAIERELGAGGMATVFLARDVKHERLVALKVLRPELAAVLGVERFLSEIRVTANLQHPHILPLFDSGEVEGLVFYVMPYVEGESLRDRLNREKQLAVEDAVEIGKAVANALDYAHRHNVIHRDIKPENILLHDGQAVVSDFGIALALSAAGGSRLTETGLSLGTPSYMSPEQATGDRTIDARSDIYSLGCVVYELLSGDPPHTGSTVQAVIAKVVTERPARLSVVRDSVPPHVEAAVHKALAKVPADRFHSAAEFAEALARPGLVSFDATLAATREGPAAPPARGLRFGVRIGLPWGLAAVAAGAALWGWLRTRTQPLPPPVARFTLELPATAAYTNQNGPTIALAPDGSRLAYTGTGPGGQQIFLRGLDQLEPVPVPGAVGGYSPFFSPDGQWLGFAIGNRLVKVAVAGGPVLTVCTTGSGFLAGATWGPRDTIAFAAGGALLLVAAAGGEPQVVAKDTSPNVAFQWPEYLPDGKALLFTIRDLAGDRLAALSLSTKALKRFELTGTNPRYVIPGYVVLPQGNGTIMAAPFDAGRLTAVGSPFPVAEAVAVGGGGGAKMGISRDGAFAYVTGGGGQTNVVLVDRAGNVRPLTTEPTLYSTPRLSPDGRRVALTVFAAVGGKSDVWVYDMAQRTRTRVTFTESAQRPIWTPDGRRIIYSRTNLAADLYWVAADGSAAEESLLVAPDEQWTGTVMPDGKTLVYRGGGGGAAKRFLATLPLAGARAPQVFLQTPFDNHSPTLSPDGRWIAYVSDESGRSEVYVRPFPGPGGRWQVSLEGATEPRWSPSGGEIFYRAGNKMTAAAVQTRPAFAVGARRELFQDSYVGDLVWTNYDVTADGRRFVMIQPAATTTSGVRIVLNWFTNLGRGGATPAGARGR